MYINMNMYLCAVKFTLTWAHAGNTTRKTGVPSISFLDLLLEVRPSKISCGTLQTLLPQLQPLQPLQMDVSSPGDIQILAARVTKPDNGKKRGESIQIEWNSMFFFRLNHRLNWVTEISNPVILTRLPFEQVDWFLLDAYAVIQQRCLQKDLQPWNSLCRRRCNCLKLKKSHDHCDHLMTSPWVGLEF